MTTPPAPRRPSSDVFTVVAHWVLVATLLVSLATGLRIAADSGAGAAGRVARPLEAILPEGAVIDWHVAASWSLLAVGMAYALFLWGARQGARIAVDRASLARIGDALRRRAFWADRPAWFALNALLFQLAFLLLLVMAATGWLLYRGSGLGLPARPVATVHGAAALGFLAYIVLHVLAQLRLGQFLKIVRVRLAFAGAGALATGCAVALIAAAVVLERSSFPELAVARVDRPPVLDGDPADPAWLAATPVTLATTGGANLPGGAVDVEVTAVHDGERVYFRFRWPDAEASFAHLPLIKRADGWEVLQTRYDASDEDVFYEDKFAVALGGLPRLGSGTVHLGRSLASGPHLPLTRGLHYSPDGSIVDMWHWKAVRTGTMRPGHLDDNHFGPPLPSEKPGVRYTGGYTQDPKSGGGYLDNYAKLDPSKPLGATRVVPRFLPADPRSLARLGTASASGRADEASAWSLARDAAVPYAPGLDTYPVGTVLPSVVIEGPFEGDRADVLGEGRWHDGTWTLEAARRLDTGSRFDLPLRPGEAVYLWVAVFNHAQIRHSRHLHPVRLALR